MYKLRPHEYIFSITNRPSCKQIIIFGIPIKIGNSEKLKNVCKNLAVDDKKIVFMNYMGKPFGCNPKYILLDLLKKNMDLDIVWVSNNICEDLKKEFPKGVRFVEYKSDECIKELASAKFWVSNYHLIRLFGHGLVKKSNQIYIQTWHGSLGIKKIEKDVAGFLKDDEWCELAKLNSQSVDYWISNSEFETNIYKQAFWNPKIILPYGHPRNDVFFFDSQKKDLIKKKVFEILGIEQTKKIVLYAPSFRDNDVLKYYSVDSKGLVETLKEKFGGDWVFVYRTHPQFNRRKLKKLNYKNAINATSYPDIQELLLTADCMLTDYSSCIFDFMLSRKPAFIFAPDRVKYSKERGLYYPLESTPFPVSANNKELVENIKYFDNNSYIEKVNKFLEEKGCVEDGHASQRVVNLIEKTILGEDI